MTGTLSLLTALIAAFSVGWGFTRGQSGFIAHPGGDALGLSAVSGRLAAGAGGPVWRAGLAGTAAGRGVRWGGSGCRRRIAAGRTALPGMRVSGATVLSVAIAIAATLLTGILRGGRHGVCFAFAVLLDWALLGALMVRIRQQESAA